MPVLILIALALAACSSGVPASSAPVSSAAGITGMREGGGAVTLELAGARIATSTPASSSASWLWPPIVDSHVHLSYYPVADALAAHGVGAVVDLGAPESSLGTRSSLMVVAAGPMITRPGGYPLSSWGANGYGIGCADTECVKAAIDRLATEGAQVIKLPLDIGGLPRDFVDQAIAHAHERHLRVAVHALSNEAALRAGLAGADILAHTPVEPLADATIEAWRGRAVISTLAAFGGSSEAVDNLRRLRAAGVTVLYGTDLGNLRVEGPSADEVALLRGAGLDDAAITAAMTTVPLAFWNLPLDLAPGHEATFLVLARDPRTDASALLAPRAVYHRGRLEK